MTQLAAPLVSTQWLADHLGADDLLVVDASVVAASLPNGRTISVSGHEQYILEAHLPGAVFADLIEDFSDPAGAHPFTRPGARRFAAAAGAIGIGDDTAVVVYDSAVGQWASRLWWLLRAFGHDNAAVLDGGITAWRAEARETDIGHVEPTPRTFTPVERPGLWAEKDEVEAIVRGEREGALLCATPRQEYTGETSPRARAGHIPGSASVPAGRLVTQDTRTALPAEALRDLLRPVLGAPRVVAYCAGGIAATAAALQLIRLGEEQVAVYDGSLNEWVADPQAPLVAVGD